VLLVEKFGPILACRRHPHGNAPSLLWTRHEAVPFFTLLYTGGSRAKLYQKGSQCKLAHQTKQYSQLSTQTTKNQPHLNPGVAKPSSTFLPDAINANKPRRKVKNNAQSSSLKECSEMGQRNIPISPSRPRSDLGGRRANFFDLRSGLNKSAKL